MLRIKTRLHVFIGTLASVAVAVVLIRLHLQINYPPEVREVVQVKAIAATIFITTCFGSVFWAQLRKSHLLALELQRLVDRDRLTNVATRDCFFRSMDERPAQAGVSLMVDIDNFKQINDTYGHLAGDEVIRRVAGILKANIRSEDIVCRFGGEEYVIFLSGRTPEQAYAVAERMRTGVDLQEIDVDGIRVSTTISIGGAQKESVAGIEVAIRAADAALYRAKAAGRNCTVFAEQDVPEPERAMA